MTNCKQKKKGFCYFAGRIHSLITLTEYIKVNASTELFSCTGRHSKRSEMELLVQVWPLYTVWNCFSLRCGQGLDLSVIYSFCPGVHCTCIWIKVKAVCAFPGSPDFGLKYSKQSKKKTLNISVDSDINLSSLDASDDQGVFGGII